MDWQGCQHLYIWFKLMVYHTPPKARARSVPVFINPCMVYHLCVVWAVWMWPPCVVACTMVYQPHPCLHWWIERGVNTCMDGWIAWYITHNLMQRLIMFLFSFLHVRPSFVCCVASMDVIPLLACLLVQWSINITHASIDGLTGVSTPVWIVGAHGISHII